jgi:hypothetical protein
VESLDHLDSCIAMLGSTGQTSSSCGVWELNVLDGSAAHISSRGGTMS